jgi:glycosyltransferase involved in cell wall biosynthesis
LLPVADPVISILMPVRNEEKFLPAALASLKAQTVSAWELVVVDDGSTDRTPAILAAAAADKRIKVAVNRAKGLVPALNQGLAACRAPLVARMDGDDVCHPERLAKQLAIMASGQGVGLVAATFRHFPRRHLKIGMLAYEEWQNSLATHDQIMADLFVESPFVHPGVMFRKELVDRLGGYRDMGWAEDYDLWLRLAGDGVRFARTAEPLLFWRDRPERATRTMDEYSADAFRRCKLHHLCRGLLQDATEVILAGAGKEGRACQRLLAAAGIKVVCWVDVDPKKCGRQLHGAMVVSHDSLEPGPTKMLVTVGTRGARGGIRAWAKAAGFVEGADFVCVT